MFHKFLRKKNLSCSLPLRFMHSQDTLQFKLLSYFENSLIEYKKLQENSVSRQILKDLPQTIALNKKLNFIYHCIQKLSMSNNKNRRKILNSLNNNSHVLNLLEPSEIYLIMNRLLKVISINNKNLKFFDIALSIMYKNLYTTLSTKQHIVQLIYFMCLRKNTNYNEAIKPIENFLPKFNNLSLMEQVAITSSYFRKDLKTDFIHPMDINNILETNASLLISEQDLLGTFCKIIRTSELYNKHIMNNLSKIIIKSSDTLTFQTLCHMISVYAMARILESNVLHLLYTSGAKFLNDDIQKMKLKIKDISRFLWSASYLNISFSTNIKSIINSYLKKRYEELKTTEYLGYFIDMLLSLYMLKQLDLEIMKICVRDNIFQRIKCSNIHWKVKNRQNILIDAVNIEGIMEINEDWKIPMDGTFTPNENLEFIKSVGTELIQRGLVKHIQIEYPIKTIFIPGITLFTDTIKYHVDIFDNSLKLQKIDLGNDFEEAQIVDTNSPNGLFNLKTRLLPKKGYRQIKIDNSLCNTKTDEGRCIILTEMLNVINDNNLCKKQKKKY